MTTPPASPLAMRPEEMRELADAATEALLARWQQLPETEAWEGDFRESLQAALAEPPPEAGRPAREVLDRALREALPFAARLDHPRSFAFVPSSPTWPGVVADFVAAGFNANVCTWLVASGPSQIELVVLDWFRTWIGYPESGGGLLTSGGSAATVDALVAARARAGDPAGGTIYASDQTHTALHRAAVIIGIARENIRAVASDDGFRMDVDALADAVARDRAAGLQPVAVCANAGATGTGTVDPLVAIADFCAAEGIWLHADAAYGGFALLCPEGRRQLRGIERTDSICLDAHKWLFQPYEAGCVMVRDVRTLEAPFRSRPAVLQDTVWGRDQINLSDRGLQLSRGFRALKIWMSIQTFGLAAFRRVIADGIEHARRAESWMRERPVMEVLCPASLGVLAFRVNRPDRGLDAATAERVNRQVLARVFWEGTAFMSSTQLDNRFSLRLCILNHSTGWQDVVTVLELIERLGREALAEIDGWEDDMAETTGSGRSATAEVTGDGAEAGELRFVLANDLQELARLAETVDGYAEAAAFTVRETFELQLCLEELFSNIVQYGFVDSRRHEIHFDFRLDPETRRLAITITDDGVEFDPTRDAAGPSLEGGLDERAIGGLGVHLVRQYVDSIEHAYRDGCNHLRLEKRLAPAASGAA